MKLSSFLKSCFWKCIPAAGSVVVLEKQHHMSEQKSILIGEAKTIKSFFYQQFILIFAVPQKFRFRKNFSGINYQLTK